MTFQEVMGLIIVVIIAGIFTPLVMMGSIYFFSYVLGKASPKLEQWQARISLFFKGPLLANWQGWTCLLLSYLILDTPNTIHMINPSIRLSHLGFIRVALLINIFGFGFGCMAFFRRNYNKRPGNVIFGILAILFNAIFIYFLWKHCGVA